MINIYLRQTFYSPNVLIPNRHRPDWFDKVKTFNNLKKMITTNCRLKIIYDMHFGDNSKELFDTYNVIKINAGTEAKSFLATLDIILSDKLNDDEIIYFLEDDYLHREFWDNALIEGLEISDYVSLYDHLDKYLHYPNLTSKILLTNSCHWRTSPSTCNTYGCKMKTLRNDFEIHQFYSMYSNNGVSQDNEKFLHLGRIGKSLITHILLL